MDGNLAMANALEREVDPLDLLIDKYRKAKIANENRYVNSNSNVIKQEIIIKNQMIDCFIKDLSKLL